MAKGYPSIARARKAFAAGYYGTQGRNPYSHPKLKEIWERGKQKAFERSLAGLGRPIPPKPIRKPTQKPAQRPTSRGSGRFRSTRRPI